MPRKKKAPDFEAAIEELEKLVTRMESGQLSLEESMQTFERGAALSQQCQQALDAAEQRIRILSEKAGAAATEAFDADAS